MGHAGSCPVGLRRGLGLSQSLGLGYAPTIVGHHMMTGLMTVILVSNPP
jgi:hypothetical protein